jgi:predicted nucleotidyltransferase
MYETDISPDMRILLARIKTSLQRIYGDRLRGVVLYGSEARGESTPDSDIEALITVRATSAPPSLPEGSSWWTQRCWR